MTNRNDGRPVGKTWPDVVAAVPLWVIAIAAGLYVLLGLYTLLFADDEVEMGWLGHFGRQKATLAIVPKDMVAAFDLVGGCPEGWADFTDAMGRTVIGADPKDWAGKYGVDDSGNALSPRAYRLLVGSEQVGLVQDQMPSLSFRVGPVKKTGLAGSNQQSNIGIMGQESLMKGEVFLSTNTIGTGAPVPIVQPSIALRYCSKL